MAALNPRLCVVLGGLVALGLVPVVAVALGQPFYVNVVTRIMVFAIAAVSLDLILGYGGMVSFGHAVYLGIGCYAVGILGFYGITNGVAQFAVAILASAAAAAIIGVLSLRTRGVYFIMITLAFGQMFYYLCVSLNIFGGDNGMTIRRASDFGAALNLKHPVTLYYLVFGVLLLFLWIGSHLVDSRFGMAVRGAKSNERRMAAMGFHVIRYKLAVFIDLGHDVRRRGRAFCQPHPLRLAGAHSLEPLGRDHHDGDHRRCRHVVRPDPRRRDLSRSRADAVRHHRALAARSWPPHPLHRAVRAGWASRSGAGTDAFGKARRAPGRMIINR